MDTYSGYSDGSTQLVTTARPSSNGRATPACWDGREMYLKCKYCVGRGGDQMMAIDYPRVRGESGHMFSGITSRPCCCTLHTPTHIDTLYSIFISHKLQRKETLWSYSSIPLFDCLPKTMIPAAQPPSPSLTFSLIIIRTPDQTQAGLRLLPRLSSGSIELNQIPC